MASKNTKISSKKIYGAPESFTSIPLIDPDKDAQQQHNLVGYINSAISNFTTLIRSELSLFQIEITSQIKRGFTGSIFFILAGAIILFSSIFFFFGLAYLIGEFTTYWAGFFIVFAVLVLLAVILAFLGWRKVKRIKKPEETIDSIKETAKIPQHIRSSH